MICLFVCLFFGTEGFGCHVSSSLWPVGLGGLCPPPTSLAEGFLDALHLHLKHTQRGSCQGVRFETPPVSMTRHLFQTLYSSRSLPTLKS